MLREGGRERRAGPVAEAEQKPNRCSVQAVKSNSCLSEKKEISGQHLVCWTLSRRGGLARHAQSARTERL